MKPVSRQSFGRIVLAGGVMALFVVLIALASSPGPQVQAQEASQAIIKVPDDHATIQAAIGAAGDGDTIQVAQGTYTENLVITESVVLEGGWRSDWLARDPALYVTTIDGNQAGRVIRITGPCTPTVDGFVITNGDATGQSSPIGYTGGGIYSENASPIIAHNTISGNVASTAGTGPGGGICLYDSDGATVEGNLIQGNRGGSGGGTGGGLDVRQSQGVTVRDNVVAYNLAAAGDGSGGYGGGLCFSESPHATIISNTIYSNTASGGGSGYGGGLFLWWSSDHAVVCSNTVYNNLAGAGWDGEGGGIEFRGSDYLTVTGNTVHHNTASQTYDGFGGGMYMHSVDHALVRGNVVKHNVATSIDEYGFGGGIFAQRTSDLLLDGNVIVGNDGCSHPWGTAWGGGIMLFEGDLRVINTVLADNATHNGQGIYVEGTTSYPSQATLVNDTVANNGATWGWGISVDRYATVAVTNTIVASHTVGLYVYSGGDATMDYTLWSDNGTTTDGTGGIATSNPVYGNPRFVDPAGGDYHIQVGSAARDAGDPAGVPPAPACDVDGDARPHGPRVDIGADECLAVYDHRLFLPLVSKNY